MTIAGDGIFRDGVGVPSTTALADGAVTTPKLADQAVTAPKIGTAAVDASKVALDVATQAEIDIKADLVAGKVPTDNTKFLRGDQVWEVPAGGGGSGLPEWFLNPGAAILPDSLFPDLAKVNGSNISWYELLYDQATAEFAFWFFHALKATDLTITIFWKTAATTGNVVWKVSTKGVASGGVWDEALATTGSVTDAAAAVAEQVNEAAIALTAPYTAGQWVRFKVERDAANASDTLAADAKLIGIRLAWT